MRVAGVLGGELLADCEGLVVGFECSLKVALGKSHVANAAQGDQDIALPSGVGGVAGSELLGDLQAPIVGVEGRLKVALGKSNVADLL